MARECVGVVASACVRGTTRVLSVVEMSVPVRDHLRSWRCTLNSR
jgi:hypothetical protein